MSPANGQVQLSPQFPVLDTLRAVGALAVLTTHTAFWAGAYTAHGVWGTVLARLDVGVAIFFVLSGFLLARPWIARAHAGLPAPAVGRYFWKRFLRIFPLSMVTAVLALALIDDNHGLSALHWLTTLTLTDIYVRDILPAGLSQMWSLATEVMFYLVLPLLMLLGVGRRRRLSPPRMVVLLVAMCAVNLAWLGGLSSAVPGAESRAVNEWLPAFLTWFAVGMAMALAHVLHSAGTAPPLLGRALERLGSSPGVCWVIAAGLLLVAATPLAGPTLLVAATETEAITKHLLYGAIGGLLVFTGIFVPATSGYTHAMSLPALRHLGHISFGVFCIHLPILHLVMKMTGYDLFQGHGPQIFLLTLGLSVAAAEVLYRVVELPCMRLKDLGRKRTVAPTAPESATSTR